MTNYIALKSKHTTQSGFSIIEAVVTLAIVLLILVLYQATINTISLTRESKNEETAVRAASAKIEQLRDGGYSTVPASGSFTSPQLSQLPTGSASLAVSDFSATAKQVIVTVQWKDIRTNATRSVSLVTVIADTGGL